MDIGNALNQYLAPVRDIFPKDNPYGTAIENFVLGDSVERTQRMAEGYPHQYTGAGPNDPAINPAIMDLAGALPIGSAATLAKAAAPFVKAAAAPAAMAAGAGMFGRAVKGANYAPTSMDDLGSALLGQSLQRQGALDDAMLVYHGSPYKFDKFDATKVSTGEGAQAYGHGVPYLAGGRRTAEVYRGTGMDDVGVDNLPMHATLAGRAAEEADVDDFGRFALGEYEGLAFGMDSSPKEIAQRLRESEISKIKRREVWQENPNILESDMQSILQGDSLRGIRDAIELGAIEKTEKMRVADWIEENADNLKMEHSTYLYEVDLPDDQIAKMLDWDKPLSEQPESVQTALARFASKDDPILKELFSDGINAENLGVFVKSKGGQIYNTLASKAGGPEKLSAKLNELGIPGIRYLDGISRNAGEGTSNYVMFDADIPTILSRNGERINSLAPKDLDPSYNARRERGQDMGFDMDDQLYHGSTHDITEFQPSGADNYYGEGVYLTDRADDADWNYAGEGPDLTNRLRGEAEQIIDQADYEDYVSQEMLEPGYGKSWEEMTPTEKEAGALNEARARLKGGNEGVIYPVAINKEGVIDETAPFMELESMDFDHRIEAVEQLGKDADPDDIEDLMMELRNTAMEDDFQKMADAIDKASYGQFPEEAKVDIFEMMSEQGEVSIQDLVDTMNRNDIFIETEEGAMLSNRAIAASIAREYGVKGIRMDAGQAFPNMVGTEGATHTIMFDPASIRSTNALFDPKKKTSKNILASAAPAALAASLYRPRSEEGNNAL
jgi:hypothetical protein